MTSCQFVAAGPSIILTLSGIHEGRRAPGIPRENPGLLCQSACQVQYPFINLALVPEFGTSFLFPDQLG